MSRPLTHLVLWGLIGSHTFTGISPASAQPVPVAGAAAVATAPMIAGTGWNDLSTRGDNRVTFDMTAAPTSIAVGEDIPIDISIDNITDSAVENVQITARRGNAVTSAEQGQQELAHGQFPFYGGVTFQPALTLGEQRQLTMNITTSAADTATLAIDEPGVYPVMLSLTGTIDNAPVAVAEERFLLTVVDSEGKLPLRDATPDPVNNADDSAAATEEDDLTAEEGMPAEPGGAGLSLLYPLTANLPIVPGEVGDSDLVLADDNLAAELAPGGRLDELLALYTEFATTHPTGAACLAIDPALLDTVDRMSAGYTVAKSRPPIVEERKRLRNSWFTQDNLDADTPGAGEEDARRFIDKLRDIECLVALPWANTSVNAVAQTGNHWLLVEAAERGPETIERILRRSVTRELVVPAEGYLTSPTAAPGVVAANTTWSGSALLFDPAVSALLAQAGELPQTAAFTDPWLRYDYGLDSMTARNITAAAAIALAGYAANSAEPTPGTEVVKLPHLLDPSTARAAFAALAATPRWANFADLPLTPATLAHTPVTDNTTSQLGAPYGDPSAFAQPEIVRAAQQARYTDELTQLMVNVPDIAMTRYGFTLPIRRELLAVLTMNQRVSQEGFTEAAQRTSKRLEYENVVLRSLRDAVSLIPPGNVYTRTSESSPLLIVAENRLPLPVRAHIDYEAADPAVALSTPSEVFIPAQGSITVTMTADMPTRQERSDIRLWLTTEQGATISEPVNIAVQTRGGMVNVYGAALAGVLVFVFALILRTSRKKKRGRKLS
ncbi:MAG: DUF6049 family protein [Corynebacterium sp.]|nr:DUF6049 family protein [Corynebacterium sp.]